MPDLEGSMAKASDEFETSVQNLRDPDARVRTRAVSRLMWSDDPRAIPPLIEALEDESPAVRRKAALALGHYHAAEATKPLIAHLRDDPGPGVRLMCAYALGHIGSDQSLNALIPMLKDPDWDVRDMACIAFAQNEDRRAVPEMMDLLNDQQWDTCLGACDALVKLKVVDERVIATIKELLDSPERVEYEEGLRGASEFLRTIHEDPDTIGLLAFDGKLPDEETQQQVRQTVELTRDKVEPEGFTDTTESPVQDLYDRARALLKQT